MQTYLLVFIGGGFGASFRHAVNMLFSRWFGTAFPYHTLFINITGSILMGLLATWFALKSGSSQSWRLFITTGILGGYTTFSAFSLEAFLLWERDQYAAAAVYILLSVAVSIAGLAAGASLIRLGA